MSFGNLVGLAVFAALAAFAIKSFTPEFKVQHGIVLVTGASTGIGRHAAEDLAKRGYIVYAGVRKQSDMDDIDALKIPGLHALKVDVTNHESCVNAVSQLAAETKKQNLPFIALVNNAGISRRHPAEFHELSDIRTVFETNFFGLVDLTQLALPMLRASEGRVVMVTSVAGVFGPPMSSVYSASKFAVEGFSDGLRRELRPHKVAVSVIQPGFVKTAIFNKSIVRNAAIFEDEAVKSEITAVYPYLYSAKAAEHRTKGTDRADEPTVTSDAIYDAIHSSQPLTRYPVANFNGIPSWLIVQALRIFPDYVVDAIFTRV